MRSRAAVLLLVLALLSAACGARLSPEQRPQALRAGGGASGSSAGTEDLAGTFEESGGEGAAEPGAAEGGAPAQGGGASGPATGGATGGTTKPGATPPPTTPKGGNGGATDVGVTATEIKIAVLSDQTGPVPGLFQSTIQAVNAWAGYINSQGGIFGRKIKVLPLDSKTDSGANRAGVLQACKEAFAMVGSMSALDDGGAGPIDQCGIPALDAIPVNPSRGRAKNSFAAFPNVAEWYILGSKKYVADTFPDAPPKAAMLYLDAAVTRFNSQKNIEAASSIGFNFVYNKPVGVVEPNYGPFVADMKNAGVQYVTMVGDNTSVARLVKAMKQQNFTPKVAEFDSVVYDPKFLQLAGDAANGIIFSLNVTPLEEASGNPELQLYLTNLKKAGGKADYFGEYAWSSARMFQQGATAVGANLTRKGLITWLQGLHKWDGNGLHAAHDPGGKKPSPCFMFMKVEGGQNKRLAPASGFDCNRAGLYAVKNTG